MLVCLVFSHISQPGLSFLSLATINVYKHLLTLVDILHLYFKRIQTLL